MTGGKHFLGFSSRLENLINMFPTVFVGSFQVMQLFSEIRYFRFELSGLR